MSIFTATYEHEENLEFLLVPGILSYWNWSPGMEAKKLFFSYLPSPCSNTKAHEKDTANDSSQSLCVDKVASWEINLHT